MNLNFLNIVLVIAPIIAGFSVNSVLRLIPEKNKPNRRFEFTEDIPRLFLFLSSIFLITASISLASILSLVDIKNIPENYVTPTNITVLILFCGFSFFFFGTILNAFRWKRWLGWVVTILGIFLFSFVCWLLFWPPSVGPK